MHMLWDWQAAFMLIGFVVVLAFSILHALAALCTKLKDIISNAISEINHQRRYVTLILKRKFKHMKLPVKNNTLRKLLAFIPFVSKYAFSSADEIYADLVSVGAVDYVKTLRPVERALLHQSLGVAIRNNYMLWHPNNPYTCKNIKNVDKAYESPYHPDNFSWEIIRMLIVKADESHTVNH